MVEMVEMVQIHHFQQMVNRRQNGDLFPINFILIEWSKSTISIQWSTVDKMAICFL